ncbi:MAG: hypothetical protein ACI9EW_001551 [Cellvibrionaceae bacterium]|jgi:hypothetical protein
MNKKIFSIISLAVLSFLLFSGGLWLGISNRTSRFSNWMMGNSGFMNGQNGMGNQGFMNGQNGNGMDNQSFMDGQNGNGMGNQGFMDGQFGSMMGGMGTMNGFYDGQMGGFIGASNADPLTLEEAETIISTYLAALNNDKLDQDEIMIFDNHAYAQIVDTSSELGAFELLIDFGTGSVYPEPGPNMMWNTEYGMMAVSGGMNMMMNSGNLTGQMSDNFTGDMMNRSFGNGLDVEINFTASEAVEIAQDYLDIYLTGKTADETADVFPGYYTLHVLENEDTIGMLSVNAFSGQVFYHNWHGELIEMSDDAHS